MDGYSDRSSLEEDFARTKVSQSTQYADVVSDYFAHLPRHSIRSRSLLQTTFNTLGTLSLAAGLGKLESKEYFR